MVICACAAAVECQTDGQQHPTQDTRQDGQWIRLCVFLACPLVTTEGALRGKGANKRGNEQEEEEEDEEDVDDVVAVGSRPQRRGLSHTQRTLAVSTNGRIKLFHPFQRCCIF